MKEASELSLSQTRRGTLKWLANLSLSGTLAEVGLLTGNYRAGAEFKLRDAGIDMNQFDSSISSFGDGASDRYGLVREALNTARAAER